MEQGLRISASTGSAMSPGAQAGAGGVRKLPISFPVTNPGEPGTPRTVRGSLYVPAAATRWRCVQLLFHGYSYGAWAWDPPGFPEQSYARTSAAAGFPVVAVDLLGYGESDRPDGYCLSTEGYAAMAHQLVAHLRSGSYEAELNPPVERVIIGGHSAGGAIGRLEAGTYHDIDGLMVLSMGDNVTPEAGQAFFEANIPMAASSDYVDPFFGSHDRRLELFYQHPTPTHPGEDAQADPEVMAIDQRLANPTPSGQIQDVLSMSSGDAIATIDVPVLLVLAERDEIVPFSEAETEPARYRAASDFTTVVVPKAGHTFFLHRNAPEAFELMLNWLRARPGIAPPCGSDDER